MSSVRVMLHLVAAVDAGLETALEQRPSGVTGFIRDPACFLRGHSPQSVALQAGEDQLDTIIDLARELAPLVDPDRSVAIVGTDRTFIEPTPTPVRFQYLMHRRHDFTHQAYLERYEREHSRFGLITPNINGYVQLHVDLERSATLATATGLGAPACDSMSELYLQSVEHFVEGIVAHPEVGEGAQADEERFVDRSRSFGFCHRVLPS